MDRGHWVRLGRGPVQLGTEGTHYTHEPHHGSPTTLESLLDPQVRSPVPVPLVPPGTGLRPSVKEGVPVHLRVPRGTDCEGPVPGPGRVRSSLRPPERGRGQRTDETNPHIPGPTPHRSGGPGPAGGDERDEVTGDGDYAAGERPGPPGLLGARHGVLVDRPGRPGLRPGADVVARRRRGEIVAPVVEVAAESP